jgi:PAS domain S-box-containing protein
MPSYFDRSLSLSDPLPLPSSSKATPSSLARVTIADILQSLDLQHHVLPSSSTTQAIFDHFQQDAAIAVVLVNDTTQPVVPMALISRQRWNQWRSQTFPWPIQFEAPLTLQTTLWAQVQDYLMIHEQDLLQDAIDRLLACDAGDCSPEPFVLITAGGIQIGDRHRLLMTYTRLLRSEQIAFVEPTVKHLQRQQQLILNAIGEGVYGVDLQGNATFVNPAAAQMIGWHPQELIGKSMHQVLHHSHSDHSPYEREQCPIYAAFQDGIVHRVSDEVFWRKDGTCFPVEYISTPMRDEQGQLVGAVVTFRDITQRKWAEAILQRTNEELEQRVRDRTAELQQANEQLKELSELRSRVVTMVCHEFRNPLNNILLSVSSLGRYDSQLTVAQKAAYLLGIQDNVARMTQMIDAVLIIGKVEATGIEMSPTRFDLIAFCRDLVSELTLDPNDQHEHQSIPGGSHRIRLISRCKRLWVMLDQCLLHSILTNILSNAMRYSPEFGEIQFKVTKQQQQVIVQITDSGIGIPSDDLPYLFEPFHRGRNVSNIAGTGLGLNIVKRFVDLQGGQIEVMSQLGKGTTFQVTLPIVYAPAGDQPSTPSTEQASLPERNASPL